MARQSGHFPITGTLGDLSFYHDRLNGYLVRRKTGPKPGAVKGNPKFQRTRENASEFAIAVQTGKLVRQAIYRLVRQKGDSRASSRLTGLLVQMGKEDVIHIRGERRPETVLGDPAQRERLRTFSFFALSKVSNFALLRRSFNDNLHSIELPESFDAGMLKAPAAATHIRFRGGLVAFNFANSSYETAPAQEIVLALNGPAQPISLAISEQTDASLFQLGVVLLQFLQEINGELYELKEGAEVWMV